MEPSRESRLAGVLLGTAVGDALGLPYEGMSRRRVQRLLRPATEQGRPRWLAVALVLPLLAVVLIAPGASTQARAGQDERATIVFVDEHGRRVATA